MIQAAFAQATADGNPSTGHSLPTSIVVKALITIKMIQTLSDHKIGYLIY